MPTAATKTASATSPLREFFNPDKCAQRRRIAASREGVEAAPVRFLGEGSSARAALEPPLSDREALELINSRLKPAEKLKPRDVYIHWIEAASSRFIADRYAFLAESTLVNIATAANAGVAFMNSHATGSLSGPPAQLPFGRTFYGIFEAGADGAPSRSIVGFYMLSGVRPNGDAGPSTDDLHAAITAGTIFDVSVGLGGGEVLCGVCGQNWSELMEFAYGPMEGNEDPKEWCPHVPGTRAGMTKAQVEAALAKGVEKGRCTYIIENATFSEVSAVYDGAVPGAGFGRIRSAMSQLSSKDRAELREALGELFNEIDGGSMSKRKTRFEPVAEDPEAKPAGEATEEETEETPSEEPIADAPKDAAPSAEAAEDAPPMPPHDEPDGDEGDGEEADDPESDEDESEPDGDEPADEMTQLRRENARLKAQAFTGALGPKFGAAALKTATELHVALAGSPELQAKFESFCAAIPDLKLATKRTSVVQTDLVEDLAKPGAPEMTVHRAALKELKAKGIHPGTAAFGKAYNDTVTRLRSGA